MTKLNIAIISLTLGLSYNTLAFEQSASATSKKAPPAKPCTTAPYKHFEFWLGEWKVLNKQGKHVGDSVISSIMNGCAMSEAWTSVTGYRGVSYNFYDKNKQQWHQTWIGMDGNPLYLDGKLIDNKMVLSGKTTANGKTTIQKITWTPLEDGRVSQHWQTSTDDGKTWNELFLGFYQAKP